MVLDNPNDDELAKLEQRVSVLETASPLDNASVQEGALRVLSQEGLIVVGSEKVTGTLDVEGTISVTGSAALDVAGDSTYTGNETHSGTLGYTGDETHSGTLDYSGNETHSGTLDYTGTETHHGDESHTGTLDYTGNETHAGTMDYTGVETHYGNETHQGNMNIEGNLDVSGGGNITAGVITIDNSGTYGGRIGAAATLELDAVTTLVNALESAHTVHSQTTVEADNDVIAYGSLKSPSIGSTTNPANVFVNTAGFLIKVTSARRFKKQVRTPKLSRSLLKVRVRDWVDKFDPTGPRVPGVIAEEVAAAEGGELFIGRNVAGKVESVHYDRFALARTQILADELEAALKRIDVLEQKLATK